MEEAEATEGDSVVLVEKGHFEKAEGVQHGCGWWSYHAFIRNCCINLEVKKMGLR
jgi:hypothetical protein